MKQFLISVDQTINTIFFNTKDGKRIWGFADEAISARAFRLRNQGWGRQHKMIDALFFWQENHCESAYESEKLRRQLPVEYR